MMRGTQVIESLADRFPQLYVAPADDAQEAHRLASGRGIAPQERSLAHFVRNNEDELREVETSAGMVEVVFLKERRDFETFLQIIGHRSTPVPIARTIGAITYRGLPDWGLVARTREAYLSDGGDDWASEFGRLASQPGAFRCELIVISDGPYSNIDAAQTPYDDAEWLRVSREIRLHHECAHVVCRRTMPEDILPVWDEVTADVVGLLCATGGYDAALAAQFLGVSAEGYAGGRLEEYLKEGQRADIENAAVSVWQCLVAIEARVDEKAVGDPFGFLLDLKRHPLLSY